MDNALSFVAATYFRAGTDLSFELFYAAVERRLDFTVRVRSRAGVTRELVAAVSDSVSIIPFLPAANRDLMVMGVPESCRFHDVMFMFSRILKRSNRRAGVFGSSLQFSA